MRNLHTKFNVEEEQELEKVKDYLEEKTFAGTIKLLVRMFHKQNKL